MHYFATIGFFDGVHQGHRCLIDQLIAAARVAKMLPMVVTFKKHPRNVLNHEGTAPPSLLTTLEERIGLLRATGISRVEVLEFTPQMASLTAMDFLRKELHPRGVRGLLMGFNHRFGSDREKSFEELCREAATIGITIKRAAQLEGEEQVSSTLIREAVASGQFNKACHLLGHPYVLTGKVEHGHQIGRTIGFPTANVVPPANKLLPADGVYFGKAVLHEPIPAIINIGTRPTVEQSGKRTVEAHLLDFHADLYGQELTLTLEHRHRAEKAFPRIEDLRAQLQADAEDCKTYFSTPR